MPGVAVEGQLGNAVGRRAAIRLRVQDARAVFCDGSLKGLRRRYNGVTKKLSGKVEFKRDSVAMQAALALGFGHGELPDEVPRDQTHGGMLDDSYKWVAEKKPGRNKRRFGRRPYEHIKVAYERLKEREAERPSPPPVALVKAGLLGPTGKMSRAEKIRRVASLAPVTKPKPEIPLGVRVRAALARLKR